MEKRIKKITLTGFFGCVLMFALLVTQIITARAVSAETTIEGGGVATPNVVKEAVNLTRSDGTTMVGDILEYTITVSNDGDYSTWKQVNMYDNMPEGVEFDATSGVTVNGTLAPHSYNNANRELIVALGDLAGADEDPNGVVSEKDIVVIKFKAVVNESAAGTVINNIVSLEGENADGEASDGGIVVAGGSINPSMTKVSENVTSGTTGNAAAGDIVKYTITLNNNQKGSTWHNVVLTDVLPAGVDFNSASAVYLNGTEAIYLYDTPSKTLSVTIGDIEGNDEAAGIMHTKVVTFEVIVNESALGTTVVNTATGAGDNGQKEASDEGITVLGDTPITPDAYCRVIYKENIGENDDKEVTRDGLKAETVINVEKNLFDNNNNEFVCWNTKPDGSGTSYEENSKLIVKSDVVLYAQWEEKKDPDTKTPETNTNKPNTKTPVRPTTSSRVSNNSSTTSAPKTGDAGNAILWMSILGLSSITGAGVFVRNKFKKRDI
jgi:fimbrial isopeptide formation D2 family protein